MRSASFTIPPWRSSGRLYDDRGAAKSTVSSPQPREEQKSTRLVEHVVQVAALRALDTRGAAVAARAAADHRRRVCNPALELVETALGDPDTAGMAVVDEHRWATGLGMDARREAADVPAVAHCPEREDRDHRVLRCMQRAEQLRHLVDLSEMVRARQIPDRLRSERRRRQLELHDFDPFLRGDGLALVGDDLLGHLDLAKDNLYAEPPLAAARLDDLGHGVLLRLRVPVAVEWLDDRVHRVQVELAHEKRLAHVQVHGAFVHGRVRARTLDDAEHRSRAAVDDAERLRLGGAERDARGGMFLAGPHGPGRRLLQLRILACRVEAPRPQDFPPPPPPPPLLAGGAHLP